MKVLFLDFDGVLNLWPKPTRDGNFDKTSCINLEMLLNKDPEIKIVVSSSWRAYGLEAIRDILKSNGIDPRRVLDIIGDEIGPDKSDRRGYQVGCWLKRHPDVKKFAIIDDETDFGPFKNRLVRTNRTVGITQNNVESILAKLEE